MATVRLSTGELIVTGARPLVRSAILAAHPIPDPPLLEIRRADGGVDLWPNRQDRDWKRRMAAAYRERDQALWEFYLVECLPGLEVPAGWRESAAWRDLAAAGISPRPGSQGLRRDYVEYALVATLEDERLLRQAFVEANDITDEDRAEAEQFFNCLWDREPIREAAGRLEAGKLSFAPGFIQFEAATAWRLLPFQRAELPAQFHHLPLYYDLPPRLRARLEVFVEYRFFIEALRADEAWQKSKEKLQTTK